MPDRFYDKIEEDPRHGDTRINNSQDLSLFLLEHADVAVVAGHPFGDDRCFRISTAADDELLTSAMDRIEAALAKLTD